jgi:hypothetical protein
MYAARTMGFSVPLRPRNKRSMSSTSLSDCDPRGGSVAVVESEQQEPLGTEDDVAQFETLRRRLGMNRRDERDR